MKTFTNSEKVTFIDEINNNLEENDQISIIATSFSIRLIEKLEKLPRNAKIRVIISDTDFKNYFDDTFDYNTEEQLHLLDTVANLIKMIEQQTLTIKKLKDISYGAVITNNYSFSTVKSNLNAKYFAYSKNENDHLSPIMEFQNIENPFFKTDFEQKWNSASDITAEIKEYLQSLLNLTPDTMYYFILNKLVSNNSLISENKNNDSKNIEKLQSTEIWKLMYKFQKDAVKAIQNRLDNFGICILADSVGLGKTFTALGIIKDYQMQGKRVLVLCPKKLQNNWEQYLSIANKKTNILDKDNFNYTVVFHTDLLRTRGKRGNIDFEDFNWGGFGLVVIDESHNFRSGYSDRKDKNGNRIENRYSFFIDNVMKGESKPDLLLLSATPVNNKFTDLENQLRMAYDGEEISFNRNFPELKNIQSLIKEADERFKNWMENSTEKTTNSLITKLDPQFLKLIETVSIARSRNHIKTFYNSSELHSFPERKKTITIDDYNDGAESEYDTIANKLSELFLTVYTPYKHIIPDKRKNYPDIFTAERMKNMKEEDVAEGRSLGMISLMRSNLLKRLESSSDSFKITIDNILFKIQNFIDIIDKYENNNSKTGSFSFDDAKDNDIEDSIETESEDESPIIQNTESYEIKLCDMDYKKWKAELKFDLDLLTTLKTKVAKSVDEDKKLKKLKIIIEEKVKNPINSNNKKIIVFTAFSDTAHYIYKNLKDWADESFNIKTALVTGTRCETNLPDIGYDFDKILTFFSPKSKFKDKKYPNENGEIDLLIATDCISEGQNLQDCDYLINYDIHWNPVRIIQRFGRIDRIGSTNKTIQLVNFWPSKDLDTYLKLKDRVEGRMAAADASGAGHGNVLTNENSKKNDIRAEQIRESLKTDFLEIKNGNMELQNSFSITDYTLSGYKTDYNDYTEKSKLEELPNGICIEIKTEKQELAPGAIFLLLEDEKNDIQAAKKKKTNVIYPYELIYCNSDGKAEYRPTEILARLRSICKDNSTIISYNSSEFSVLENLLNKSIHSKNSKQMIDSLYTPDAIINNDETKIKNELICSILIN